MEFTKFKGKVGNFLTFMTNFEAAYKFNNLPEENKGEWLISQLEGKAQEAVKMIQEPQPSFEKVKKTLELLYHKPKDSTTKLMELDNLKSSDYDNIAEFAHDLTVKAADAYPALTGIDLDRVVMAKLLRGLPKKTRERFDSSLYPSTTLLVQSIQQAEELEKIDAPSDQVFSGKKAATLIKPAPEAVVVCAPVACSPTPDATVLAIAALETRLQAGIQAGQQASDRRQDDRSRQMIQDIDQLSRDYNDRRPMSPYRPTSTLSNFSSASRDGGRSVSRGGDYARGRSPSREGRRDFGRDTHIPLQESIARVDQARKIKAMQKNTPPWGERTSGKGGGNPPPAGYTGGYRGTSFNPRIWEAQKLAQAERRGPIPVPVPPARTDTPQPPPPPPDKPPTAPPNS
jgi:hypothetical protein